ncbi:MAG: Bacterial regulatory protein luxR family, partial [Planctomycetota bacterium]
GGVMQHKVDIRSEEVARLLADRVATAAWEALRQARSPMSAQELASTLGAERSSVQDVLDRLCTAGLTQRIPMTRNHRAVRYAVEADRLVIDWEPTNGTSVAALRAYLRASASGRHASEQDASEDAVPDLLELLAHDASGVVDLNEDDRAELARRIGDLVRFIHVVRSRRPVRGAVAPQRFRWRIDMTVRPAVHEPPHAIVQAAPEATPTSTPTRNGDVPGGNAPLAPREREVAAGLVAGLTRPEIAKHLGVSPYTVATLVKRIYRKLGVRRRIELAHRLNGTNHQNGIG